MADSRENWRKMFIVTSSKNTSLTIIISARAKFALTWLIMLGKTISKSYLIIRSFLSLQPVVFIEDVQFVTLIKIEVTGGVLNRSVKSFKCWMHHQNFKKKFSIKRGGFSIWVLLLIVQASEGPYGTHACVRIFGCVLWYGNEYNYCPFHFKMFEWGIEKFTGSHGTMKRIQCLMIDFPTICLLGIIILTGTKLIANVFYISKGSHLRITNRA